jgi:hypothetical protein
MKINEENKLEVIKNQEKIKDKKEENEEKNDKKAEKLEKFDSEQYISVNSPKLIQEILHLSARMPEDRTTENNIIKSLYSVNEKILPILQSGSNIDDDIDVTNFNPYLQEKMRKNNLLKLNFKEISIDNNYLNTKLKQYKDLEQIISDYSNKDSQLQTENLEQKKMFLIKHPLISLFKEKIDLKKIEKDLYNEYQNKMKDNTKYKYQAILNLQNDNHLNNNDNNDNDYQDNSIIESYSNNSNEEDQEEEEYNFDNSDDNSNMSLELIDNHIINANAEQNHNNNNDNNNANNENNNNNDTNNNNNNNNQNINDNNSSDNYSGDNVI